jgi:PHP family Zn ribbon phosphoesterase
MRVVADLQLHSKYALATSKDMDLEHLAEGAKVKGLNLLGTGDFTHPKWFAELREKLEPIPGAGLYSYRGMTWMLAGEVSTVYEQGAKTRKIHHLIYSHELEVVAQINEVLSKRGKLSSDGRPVLKGIDSAELVEQVTGVSKEVVVIPAHCLLPTEVIITNPGAKPIQEAKVGDYVFTHMGRPRRVIQVLNRPYDGDVLRIIPWYFSTGLELTPEHPVLAIKTVKDCNGGGGICKPSPIHARNCYHHYYKDYMPKWVPAGGLNVGDALLYPRVTQVADMKELPVGTYDATLRQSPNVGAQFCRLAGYYLAEGYSNGRDGIGFAFGRHEPGYVDDVKTLVSELFGIKTKRGKTEGDVLIHSKGMMRLFESLFYDGISRTASHKCMPDWMIYLPKVKQVEILRGWWRGDRGSTSSLLLFEQMKIICLRMGIVPSIRIDRADSHRRRGHHSIDNRTVEAHHDNYMMEYLAFFEDGSHLLDDDEFKRFVPRTNERHGWVDDRYVYLPIRKISRRDYAGLVYNLEVESDNSYLTGAASVHNCWTPWFGVFGSRSGFDSLEECYQDQAAKIFAIETGLSCYDGLTEVLTEAGWKKFKDLTYDDGICSMNAASGKIEFQKPTRLINSGYRGKMYRLKTRRIDLLVTPNHKLFVTQFGSRGPKPFRLEEAQYLFGRSKTFRKDGVWEGVPSNDFVLPAVKIRHGSRFYSGFRKISQRPLPIKPWLKFLGLWTAEGHTNLGEGGDYSVVLSNSDWSLVSEMVGILKELGYHPVVLENRPKIYQVRVRNYQLFTYLRQFGQSHEKFVPREIMSLSKDLLSIFLNYYLKGDGHVYGRNGKGLSSTTTSLRLRDDLQELALKVGFSAYYKLGSKKGTPLKSLNESRYRSRYAAWVVYFIRRNRHGVTPSTVRKYGYAESWVNFAGKVYCVTVPNHVIYVRRNGIPVWCGNSDPQMNWRLSSLDKVALVSNSDAHSPNPWRLGREANVFEFEKLSYRGVFDAIRLKDRSRFLHTIEVDPAYGKYHFTGHKKCKVSLPPGEALQMGNKCPKCGKKLTVGVLQRVEELADRPEGFRSRDAIPFRSLLPLYEVISFATGVNRLYAKAVLEQQDRLIGAFGSELAVLLDAPLEDLLLHSKQEVAQAIVAVRENRLKFTPGYDGVYGVPSLQ